MLQITEGIVLESIAPFIIPLAVAAVGAAASAYSAKKNAASIKSINQKALDQEKWIAEENFKRQDEAYDYQKQLNELTMSREDNAVQRRVQDLKAAGLNPVLAAGDAASSASFRAGSAPQYDSSYIGNYAQRALEAKNIEFNNKMALNKLMLDFASQAVDISRTKAEAEVLNERAADIREKRPSSVENMNLANSFLRSTLDTRVEREVVGLSRDRKLDVYQGLQNQLVEKNIDYADVRLLLGYADLLYKDKQMSKVDKEILVMESLIKSRELEQEERRWNLDYFKGRNEPTTYRDPAQIKIVHEILKSLEGGRNGDDNTLDLPGIKPFKLFEYDVDDMKDVPDWMLKDILEAEEDWKRKHPNKSK